MKGKKLVMLTLAIMLLLAIPAVVFAGGKAKATATPPTKIEATFQFKVLSKTELLITGNAKGMEPGHTYRSLVYGKGSTDKGIHACEREKSVGGSMFVGIWDVDEKGKGTLSAVSDADLKKIKTISVRAGGVRSAAGEDDHDPVPTVDHVVQRPPVILCGKVK